MSGWTRSCRDVSALLLARADRRLTLRERWALRWHMVICKACPNFESEVTLLQRAIQRWRHYREE
jgi:hypothetical protein